MVGVFLLKYCIVASRYDTNTVLFPPFLIKKKNLKKLKQKQNPDTCNPKRSLFATLANSQFTIEDGFRESSFETYPGMITVYGCLLSFRVLLESEGRLQWISEQAREIK